MAPQKRSTSRVLIVDECDRLLLLCGRDPRSQPLRGHDLGAWLVSETVHRMLPTGLVLMWPYPVLCTGSPGSDPDADPDADPVHIAALDSAIGRLSDHFGRCGLTRVESAAGVPRIRESSSVFGDHWGVGGPPPVGGGAAMSARIRARNTSAHVASELRRSCGVLNPTGSARV